MFRLLKLCLSLAAFLAFVWFGATVNLGSHTLFEHLHAIGQTKESKELVDGTKQVAEPIVDDVRRRIARGGDKADQDKKDDKKEEDKDERQAALPRVPPDAGAAQDDFSPSERRKLRRLLGVAERHVSLK
jgi:hypothetical protein